MISSKSDPTEILKTWPVSQETVLQTEVCMAITLQSSQNYYKVQKIGCCYTVELPAQAVLSSA